MRPFLISLYSCVMMLVSSTASAIEEPSYNVVKSWDELSVEIRDYDARILAVTKMGQGANAGFGVLAGYIFGGNETAQEIAMTAPVQRTIPAQASEEMAFVRPSEFAMEELP